MISFHGYIRLKVISADCAQLLYLLSQEGVQISDIQYIDELTVCFSVNRCHYRQVKQIVRHREDQLFPVSVSGAYWLVKGLFKRPVLIIGTLLLLFLILFLPTRVLFVCVKDNQSVPANLILEKAGACGISFGASRQRVRSEKVKNQLLGSIPELQWAGINTYGCLAVISVEEKDQSQGETESIHGNIVAVRDGVITNVSVTKGTAKCQVGQSVKQGQILVSGYANYGIKLVATGADAEIFAQTGRSVSVITPTVLEQKRQMRRQENRYSLLIGKKLINFYKDSGILGGECVRIYEEYHIVLPGGYRLPLGLIKEQQRYYDYQTETLSEEKACTLLTKTAESYLDSTMLAGEILGKYTHYDTDGDVCRLFGTYRCHELIGRIHKEEILQRYEQRN